MATRGCGGDLSETVEDIVSMTSKMGVNSEEDWEENEEAASSFGEHSLVGRMIAKREIKESLFTTIFSHMWKGIGGWEVKVLAEEEDDSFVGITFKNQEEAKGILSKQPWIFNGGLLLLERWPSSGQWREAKLDKVHCWVKMKGWPIKAFTRANVTRLGEMDGDIQEIRWINESRMFLNGFVRMKIGCPLNQSIFVGSLNDYLHFVLPVECGDIKRENVMDNKFLGMDNGCEMTIPHLIALVLLARVKHKSMHKLGRLGKAEGKG
ncbi:hypothetical protein F8388_025880 [Cannabis sativa]|uniref:DUF4283 domain-containing protein n=1 Tax=Cannabis sativa TaxID=3483 RepID=A0A7J6F9W1_CANSA|nr:hypothetical protein F8388_025880 [Cannabis sativa]